MKKAASFFIVFFLSLGLSSFAEVQNETSSAPTEKVRIAKIKIIIDGNEYEWTKDGVKRLSVDSAAASTVEILRPETIQSFLSVYPNETATEDALHSQCRASELRLLESGYVYEASLQIIPPRKNPMERTIVVTVSSGFLWRFGGGGIFGMVGKDGIGGDRVSVRLYAGWNRNGIKYVHYNVGDSSFVLGGSLFYLGPGKKQWYYDNDGNRKFGCSSGISYYCGIFYQPGVACRRGRICFSSRCFAERKQSLFHSTIY